jgi:protein-S-isoprenylcysteine O-methyltransferase Ste14
MIKIAIFLLLSVPLLIISWRSLFQFKNHGFYRFLSWECILWLTINVIPVWFKNPFSVHQIISWILLIVGTYVVLAGVLLMRKIGKPKKSREDDTLFTFEKTTELIKQGIFKYIRHPLYGSLLILTWGIFFKQPTLILFAVSVASTAFLFLTALAEEKEDIAYFGDAYREYMKESKMFIPFVI